MIEVNTGEQPSDVKLVEPGVVPEAKYIALSYCWGKDQFLRTTRVNIEAHKRGMKWHLLPPLFQEVITIAQRLRVPYVWIDSLCMVQGDVADWSLESANMTTYYTKPGSLLQLMLHQGPVTAVIHDQQSRASTWD